MTGSYKKAFEQRFGFQRRNKLIYDFSRNHNNTFIKIQLTQCLNLVKKKAAGAGNGLVLIVTYNNYIMSNYKVSLPTNWQWYSTGQKSNMLVLCTCEHWPNSNTDFTHITKNTLPLTPVVSADSDSYGFCPDFEGKV